jgi:hypothetical protein
MAKTVDEEAASRMAGVIQAMIDAASAEEQPNTFVIACAICESGLVAIAKEFASTRVPWHDGFSYYVSDAWPVLRDSLNWAIAIDRGGGPAGPQVLKCTLNGASEWASAMQYTIQLLEMLPSFVGSRCDDRLRVEVIVRR